MGATQSVLLYGRKVWADVLDKVVYHKRLVQVRRLGASRMAVMVFAGVMPVALRDENYAPFPKSLYLLLLFFCAFLPGSWGITLFPLFAVKPYENHASSG